MEHTHTHASIPGKKVIVAVDGSDNSIYALEWYANHLHKIKDIVILVYCVEIIEATTEADWINGRDGYAYKNVFDEDEEKRKKFLKGLEEHLIRLQLRGTVKSIEAEKPGEGILEVANEEGATLIISGSRGLGKVRRTLCGSVSEYLVHHSHIPVLVCRLKEERKGIK